MPIAAMIASADRIARTASSSRITGTPNTPTQDVVGALARECDRIYRQDFERSESDTQTTPPPFRVGRDIASAIETGNRDLIKLKARILDPGLMAAATKFQNAVAKCFHAGNVSESNEATGELNEPYEDIQELIGATISRLNQ